MRAVGTDVQVCVSVQHVHDADNDALTYTATKSDGGRAAHVAGLQRHHTQTFSGMPATDGETLAVKVTASDGRRSRSATNSTSWSTRRGARALQTVGPARNLVRQHDGGVQLAGHPYGYDSLHLTQYRVAVADSIHP